MKRLASVLVAALVIYVIYFDLSHGTLPSVSVKEPIIEAKAPNSIDLSYFDKRVKPGETVLSIIESELNEGIPVSIDQVIQDFKQLNNGQKPEEIQIGKTYKFPNYKQ